MSNKFILIFFSVLIVSCNSVNSDNAVSIEYTKYANPLTGTDFQKKREQVHKLASSEEKGQTMPAVGIPNGMTNWVAQTMAGEQKCNSPYYYYHNKIQGFRTSRWLNGSCVQDYGSVTIMPLSGKLETGAEERASLFSHNREVSMPHYYSVLLEDYDIMAELAGLSRACIMQFEFNRNEDRYIVIEPNSDEGLGYVEIDPEKKEVRGYNPVHRIYQGWGESAGFNGWFVIKFEDDFAGFGTWKDSTLTESSATVKGEGNATGAWVKLVNTGKSTVKVKVGTSFTGMDKALLNLDTEIAHWDFDKVKQQSHQEWEKALGQIAVKSNDEIKLKKFYSALYAAMLYPRTFSDVDGSYPGFAENYTVHKADGFTYYCDFSMWDTYRAVQPLLTILNPTMSGEMIRSYIIKGELGGWLPIFPMWNNYTAAMIGDHGLSIISDAIMKGIGGFDYEKAYSLMRKNAFEVNTDFKSYSDGKGRRALESYLKYNYVPLEDSVWQAFHRREQVSRTLEYAYDDFVLSQVAKKLGKTGDYEKLTSRAKNYRNVIDPETGYARGRYADGRWIEPFDPYKFVNFICEGTPYHYTWYVPHDIPGLISHLGKERFSQSLTELFEGGYYWHGNEPCHHIPYLFAMSGEAWKTQKWVHSISESEYAPTPDGLCGNDDAGQMSSWLVFSMMGFYPVCPGTSEYIIGSPAFEETVITLETGKTFTVKADNFAGGNIYIQSAELNGKPFNRYYITHDDIMSGGVLKLVMGNEPNKQWPVAEK